MWLALSVSAGHALGQPPDPPADPRGTIALDAGHGGKESGGRGPQGTLEKEVCLALVRHLTRLLEPDYRVILTRSDDYDVALPERTAIANHHDADLLISIHTAAGFTQAADGIAIYYFKPSVQAAEERPQSLPDTQVGHAWNRVQIPHTAASRTLAALIQQSFETVPGIPSVQVAQAPLQVLEGANMPAVLLEVGYLTHAASEKSLNTPERQAAYAQAIARAIDSFMASLRPRPHMQR
ncbi:MAG: N-acetylmuramoyl-L-alanine amidase [Desulfatitalea sp.]